MSLVSVREQIINSLEVIQKQFLEKGDNRAVPTRGLWHMHTYEVRVMYFMQHS